MMKTPKGLRLHIGIFGRRNVGKSSLLNALAGQAVSIVSAQAGTTTDPVEKPMEFLPLGPVLFIDTAGMDDEGALGELRMAKTRQVFERTDVAILVTDGMWTAFEEKLLAELRDRKTPVIVVRNKSDLTNCDDPRRDREGALGVICDDNASLRSRLGLTTVATSAVTRVGLAELRMAILAAAPADFIDNPAIVSDLVGPGELAVLVVPIDKEAPKGRLILPQVQTIRDLLDGEAMTMVVKEHALSAAIERLKVLPKLVITDSQAFLKVAGDTPADVPLTSFSILFSRFKGDLLAQVRGALAIDTLRGGDRVLIAEACSHHPICEDIGRVKIPRWLTRHVGAPLMIEHVQGHDFPADLSPYKLVIHCGACMWNRREMLGRIARCQDAGIPITNYGLTIAYSLGIFERALGPFPAAREEYRRHIATRKEGGG
ncbi:MAG: [FeFe] hydrogenase H-cluster maturation GTPase HydF [Phycisphaerales bacterium]|nr:[FeFe] hydrogenase H-cluster maturation GTPase HydF [Phycisphaerales bacterium]